MARNSTSTARKSGKGKTAAASKTKEEIPVAREDEGAMAEQVAEAVSGAPADAGAAAVPQWATPFPVPDSEALAPLNENLLGHASTLSGDLLSFGQKRFTSDLETMGQLCRCSSPAEVSEVQRQWFDKAAEDYGHDGVELCRSAGAFLSEAMQAPFQVFGAMSGSYRPGPGGSR